MTSDKNNSGFIALMSSIIISVILLLIAVTLSFTGLNIRFNILDSELKERINSLAEACVDIALLKLVKDSNYQGGEDVTVSGSDTCIIKTINPIIDPVVIDTKAIFKQATTNLRIKVNKSNLKVISWEEVPTGS